MNVVGINFESIVDGEGVRVVVYCAGCTHACKGCHNPESHNFSAGREFTAELQESVVEYVKKTPFISGVTLSGGDPMLSAGELIPFIYLLKGFAPSASIWVYSGFTLESVVKSREMYKLLSLCDVLVDGKFILEQRDVTLAYRGSRNQRVIDVKKTLSQGEVIEYRSQ
jgi:anaerobic ribonucleoside-triphosphate reductase activating protein